MRGYIAFTRKEFTEQIRTYKTLIMLAVFVVFGMMSPLLAKLMPEFLSSMAIEGVKITMADPTYLDAYTQFFKNITQMGIIVTLLVFSGCVSSEVTKGTLINILSKGISRSAVIISKYTASVTLWTLSFAAAAAVNYGYTAYLFGSHSTHNLLLSCLCLWLFGAFVISVTFFASTLTKGNYGGLLVTAAILGVLLMLNMMPESVRYNPVSLAANNMALLNNTVSTADMMAALGVTLVSTVLCLTVALCIFRKKIL
ncbi:MAG: ABC transporter permease subunit [Eubacteriales bacterium]|nr:ABC transporter permease subunit [Eubacteriales bacterium]